MYGSFLGGGGGGCEFLQKNNLILKKILQIFAPKKKPTSLHTHIKSSCDELQLQAIWILQWSGQCKTTKPKVMGKGPDLKVGLTG